MDHCFGYYDKYGIWQKRMDVYPEDGAARQWADCLLKKGIKVLVGSFSVQNGWVYCEYNGKLPRGIKGRLRPSKRR